MAHVVEHHRELQESYGRHRANCEQVEAFANAARDVLDDDDQSDLTGLIRGSYDDVYGAGKGGEFARFLLSNLEEGYQDDVAIAERVRAWNDMDAVTLARCLAMDSFLAHRFTAALQTNNDASADRMAWNAVNAVAEKSSRARTKMGRAMRLQRSAAAFKGLGTTKLGDFPTIALMGLSMSGHDDMAELTLWCEAVYQRFGLLGS